MKQIIRGILNGLAYIHRQGYVHGDIKTMNILMADADDFSKIKIIDFGICQKVKKRTLLEKRWGTLMYIAPEIIKKEGYGPVVDIWSTAIILYKLCMMGKHPFLENAEGKKEILQILGSKELPKQDETLPCPLAQDLFEKMTIQNQFDRINARKALAHPFLE